MPSNPKNVRKCCACHEHADKSEMLRFVKTPDGHIMLDEGKTADGRGVWLHNSDECKAKAVKKKLLNSAFKTAVPQEIYDGLIKK